MLSHLKHHCTRRSLINSLGGQRSTSCVTDPFTGAKKTVHPRVQRDVTPSVLKKYNTTHLKSDDLGTHFEV